jgi:hypothetical protein
MSNVQVLQVAPGEIAVRDDLDLVPADLADGDVLSQVAGAALDLDAVVQELLERGQVVDFVGDGLGAVDDELLPLANSQKEPTNHLLRRLLALLGRGSVLLRQSVTMLAYCARGRDKLGRQQSEDVLLGPFRRLSGDAQRGGYPTRGKIGCLGGRE